MTFAIKVGGVLRAPNPAGNCDYFLILISAALSLSLSLSFLLSVSLIISIIYHALFIILKLILNITAAGGCTWYSREIGICPPIQRAISLRGVGPSRCGMGARKPLPPFTHRRKGLEPSRRWVRGVSIWINQLLAPVETFITAVTAMSVANEQKKNWK